MFDELKTAVQTKLRSCSSIKPELSKFETVVLFLSYVSRFHLFLVVWELHYGLVSTQTTFQVK